MDFTDEVGGVNPVETAERVRKLRGMSPINPNKIEGFGPNEPPPAFDNPYPPLPAESVSPLIPREAVQPPQSRLDGVTTGSAAQVTQLAAVPPEGIVVFYNGQPLPIWGKVAMKVEALVLEQVIEEAREKLKIIKAPRVRAANLARAAGQAAATVAPSNAAADPSPSKRGQGRPKGSRNKPKPELPTAA